MYFREVVDRIFNEHLLIAYCVAGTAQSILHAISLLISAHLSGWHYYHLHFTNDNVGHCETQEFVGAPSAFKWKNWNLNPEPSSNYSAGV